MGHGTNVPRCTDPTVQVLDARALHRRRGHRTRCCRIPTCRLRRRCRAGPRDHRGFRSAGTPRRVSLLGPTGVWRPAISAWFDSSFQHVPLSDSPRPITTDPLVVILTPQDHVRHGVIEETMPRSDVTHRFRAVITSEGDRDIRDVMLGRLEWREHAIHPGHHGIDPAHVTTVWRRKYAVIKEDQSMIVGFQPVSCPGVSEHLIFDGCTIAKPVHSVLSVHRFHHRTGKAFRHLGRCHAPGQQNPLCRLRTTSVSGSCEFVAFHVG